MIRWFQQLDRIMRGELTRPEVLLADRFRFSLFGLGLVAVVLAMIYGACMGAYSVFRVLGEIEYPASFRQMLASTVKTPALFFLTLLITLPSLYVFSALVGSRLRLGDVVRLLIASLGVNLAVLASLGPIVAFFSLSTNSYAFMVLLNVGVFAASGLLGLLFLVQTMNRLQHSQREAFGTSPPSVSPPAEVVDRSAAPAPIERIDGQVFGYRVKALFAVWIIVFGLVGAQMGWILRPFIGSPNEEFRWFRHRDSNFFEALGNTTAEAFGEQESPRAAPPSSDSSIRR
ncbi:MAG: hypothetical protein JNK76_13330 [Planctomycetales bacterium]|nr:hypothetical protein [Planctomycetales bacterium]